MAVLYAEREILKGEEICIRYRNMLDVRIDYTTAESYRDFLRTKWSINCPGNCFCRRKKTQKLLKEARTLDEMIVKELKRAGAEPLKTPAEWIKGPIKDLDAASSKQADGAAGVADNLRQLSLETKVAEGSTKGAATSGKDTKSAASSSKATVGAASSSKKEQGSKIHIKEAGGSRLSNTETGRAIRGSSNQMERFQGPHAHALRWVEELREKHVQMQSTTLHMRRTIYDGFQLAIMKNGTLPQGTQYMREFCKIQCAFLAPHCPAIQEYHALIDNPDGHENYLIGEPPKQRRFRRKSGAKVFKASI